MACAAQGLRWDAMHGIVQAYSKQMGSIRHLLSDLTLPLISVFSGHGFDHVVRESFAQGAQRIEDLWLRSAPRVLRPLPAWTPQLQRSSTHTQRLRTPGLQQGDAVTLPALATASRW